jgi:hypothetical protein
MAACTAASAAAVAAAIAALTAICCMRTALDLAALIIDDLDFRADDLFFAIRHTREVASFVPAAGSCGKNAAVGALFHCIANHQVTANVLDAATGGRHNGKGGLKKARKPIPRHAERHLLRREENPRHIAKDGESGAVGRT